MKKRVISYLLANILIYCLIAFIVTADDAYDILDDMVLESEYTLVEIDNGLSNAWPTLTEVKANDKYISEAIEKSTAISYQTKYTACYAVAMQDGKVIVEPNGKSDSSKFDNRVAKQAIKNIEKYKDSLNEEGIRKLETIFSYKKVVSRQLNGIEGSVITEYISFVGKPFSKAMNENAFVYINIVMIMAILNGIVIFVVKNKDKLFAKKKNIIIYFVLVNIAIFLIASLRAIVIGAKEEIDYAKSYEEEYLINRWNEIAEDKIYDENHIDGGSHLAKLAYEYGNISFQGIHETIYAVAFENDEIYTDLNNKMSFDFRIYLGEDENLKRIDYYRIIDFDKFFTKEELEDMTEFFKETKDCLATYGEFYVAGKMDDTYIYPTYIAWGSENNFEHNKRYILSTDEQYDKDAEYDLVVYVIDKEYSYENEEALVDVTSFWTSEEDDEKVQVYEGNYNGRFDNKLSKEAISNIYKYKDQLDVNGTYEKINIFTYEKVYSRQREVDGHNITEYLSYVRKPFKDAFKYYVDYHNYQLIIFWMIPINIMVFLAIYKLIKKRNAYEEKARELFYDVTDKLTESVDNIKKINSEIISGEDKSKRDILDKEIKNLVGYIKDVLEWSKADAGVLEIYPEEIEISYMVEAVIKDVSKHSNIKIVTDMDMDAIVDGDLSRVAKAVAAFIRDVISKTDASETVSVLVKQNDGTVCFKVTNSENLNKFQYKDESKLITKFDLLLGMSYVKLHGGKCWYNNEDGKVTHTFEIPVNYVPENKKKKDGKVKDIYGVIAHEIKTPLNVIKLYNEALMDGGISDDKEQKYNAVIDTQLEIITNQIHEVASASHLKTGNLKGIKEKVDMAVLVNDMVARYNVLMEDKQLKVTVDGEKTVEAYVDYTGVKSIISNYIINAVKYSDNGSDINITLEKDDKYATIKIANDIPQNLRYNVDDTKQGVINRIERDGLGLIIARTYLDICKAKYGCNQKDDTVEYWLKFRLK